MEKEWSADEAVARFKEIRERYAEHQASINDAHETRLRGLFEAIKLDSWNAAIDAAAAGARGDDTLAHIRGLRRE